MYVINFTHMKYLSFLALAALVLVGAGCASTSATPESVSDPIEPLPVDNVGAEFMDEFEELEDAIIPLVTQVSQLKDVTGGESTGLATVMYWEDNYDLSVMLYNLPELEEGFFYEGWIVRRGDDMSVISTGATTVENSIHLNIFESDNNFTDHDFYVLTLEPDDGDPAPAEHILEGVLKSQ